MKILISNDDGIFAPGIEALVAAFAGAGHEVIVCAPDSQRSAASHGLTIGKPLTVKEMDFPGAKKAYAIGGTPADCVKLGLMVLCPEVEAVVSGVNRGYNVGSDILYSGTVAAAMEGAICGRPALAISQTERRMDYSKAADLAASLFETMIKHPLGPLRVLNVNYPECDEIRGVVTAKMDQLHYTETYSPTVHDGLPAYALSGVIDEGKLQSDDYQKLCQGYATVTILQYDMTDLTSTNVWNALV
ncbi:MAG: 5'/3'-nucleotidase SurE [Clostridiales bacterium]|nr:5'/3'-nucleotidase SurE [Clostridiales bacterium]